MSKIKFISEQIKTDSEVGTMNFLHTRESELSLFLSVRFEILIVCVFKMKIKGFY